MSNIAVPGWGSTLSKNCWRKWISGQCEILFCFKYFSNKITFMKKMLYKRPIFAFQTWYDYVLYVVMQKIVVRVPGTLKMKVKNKTSFISSLFIKENKFFTYLKNKSTTFCIAALRINSFSAAWLPTDNNTAMNSTIFKRCFPRGGCNLPYVVNNILSADETSKSFSKSPAG